VFAKRKALEYEANGGFSEMDELIIEAVTMQEAKSWEACFSMLKSLRALLKAEAKHTSLKESGDYDGKSNKYKMEPEEAWAVYYYLRGCCFSGLNKLDKAESYFKVQGH